MNNTPEVGSDRTCPHCALKQRNQHSLGQSAECDGIRTGKITGTRAMEIRIRNGAKKTKQAREEVN